MRLKKGFTLAELLIVVAIIAILVAIGIPVFNSQLEKSKEATDAANIRSKYAEMMTEIVSGNYNNNKYVVQLVQTKDDWQTSMNLPFDKINGIPKKNGKATLYYKDDLSILDFGNNTSIDEIKKNATEYSTSNQYNKKGTLYVYNGTYFIATDNKEGDEVPSDNEKSLFKVNFDNIFEIDSQTDEEYEKISVGNHRGDVIYVKDENKYYVIYDTNKKINKDSKKQDIKFN